mgnify:CR=1 FL=1
MLRLRIEREAAQIAQGGQRRGKRDLPGRGEAPSAQPHEYGPLRIEDEEVATRGVEGHSRGIGEARSAHAEGAETWLRARILDASLDELARGRVEGQQTVGPILPPGDAIDVLFDLPLSHLRLNYTD